MPISLRGSFRKQELALLFSALYPLPAVAPCGRVGGTATEGVKRHRRIHYGAQDIHYICTCMKLTIQGKTTGSDWDEGGTPHAIDTPPFSKNVSLMNCCKVECRLQKRINRTNQNNVSFLDEQQDRMSSFEPRTTREIAKITSKDRSIKSRVIE